MTLEIFDLPNVTPAQLIRATAGFADKAFASAFVDRGIAEMQNPSYPSWVASAVLVGAFAAERLGEALPSYENFLNIADACTKPDWHTDYTNLGLQTNNLFAQSARFAQDPTEFSAEFQRVTSAIGAPGVGRVLDVGCGGGLWALHMAKFGYQVTGTDSHPGVVAAASRTAMEMGVADKANFVVDDISDSTIPSGFASRIICIGVTPTLPNDDAFQGLVRHLDRISRLGEGQSEPRRVVLGQNRWGPSRLAAAQEILEAAGADFAKALTELNRLEICWWMQPRHLETVKAYFPAISQLAATRKKCDGVRMEYLLQ